MAHPHANIRQSKVERSRVASITKGYASGGAVTAAPSVAAKAGPKATAPKFAVGGAVAKARQDRPGRARGGRAPKSTVNVIVAPQGGAAGAPLMPPAGVAGPGPAPMPMRPPIAPPGPPPMAGPPPGGPMPIRSSGGRAYASGGAVKPGPAFEEGKRLGTQVTHSPNKNDGKDIGRKRVITYKTGGAVEAPKGKMGPKLPGGGRGGLGRLAKAKRAAKSYAKA